MNAEYNCLPACLPACPLCGFKGIEACYNRTGRQIVQSVESCDAPSGCGQWVPGVANLWRTSGDIQNTWASVMNNIHDNNLMADIASPGWLVGGFVWQLVS